MKYAIETLEIEVGRLKQSLRTFRTTTMTSSEKQYANIPSEDEIEAHIRGLEKSIKILREYEEEHSY